jgi:hypothetical protein
MPASSIPLRRESRPRLVLLLPLSLAFSAGYLARYEDFGPGDVRSAWRSWFCGDGEAERGWWTTLSPSGATEDGGAAAPDLSALGYAQGYREGAPESGVRLHEAADCAPGLNLVVSAHASEASLMDLEGRTLHRWAKAFEELWPDSFDPRRCKGQGWWRRAWLLADGHLLALFDGFGLIHLDRDSNVVWALEGGYHHALDVMADGSIWVLLREARVVPRIHATRPILEDFLVHLTPDGERIGRFSLLEAIERSRFAPLLEGMADEGDLFHTNALDVLEGEFAHLGPAFGAGHALISVRELDVIGTLDLERQELVWALTGLWDAQHEPVLLPDRRMLVFDNLGRGGESQVLELDPLTQEVHWSYAGLELGGLSSPLCGMAQRLANGNTLITESLAGRALEVTRAGRLVWLYQTPHRADQGGAKIAVLMQVERIPPDRLQKSNF